MFRKRTDSIFISDCETTINKKFEKKQDTFSIFFFNAYSWQDEEKESSYTTI